MPNSHRSTPAGLHCEKLGLAYEAQPTGCRASFFANRRSEGGAGSRLAIQQTAIISMPPSRRRSTCGSLPGGLGRCCIRGT